MEKPQYLVRDVVLSRKAGVEQRTNTSTKAHRLLELLQLLSQKENTQPNKIDVLRFLLKEHTCSSTYTYPL